MESKLYWRSCRTLARERENERDNSERLWLVGAGSAYSSLTTYSELTDHLFRFRLLGANLDYLNSRQKTPLPTSPSAPQQG